MAVKARWILATLMALGILLGGGGAPALIAQEQVGGTPTPGPAPAPTLSDRLGVYFWDSAPVRDEAALQLVRQAGIGWVRVVLGASEIEPSADQFEWDAADTLLSQAAQQNVQVLAVLAYAQKWNTTAPPDVQKMSKREHYPPRDYAAWGQFVFETVSHYKGTVHAWEVWNEPDLSGGWGGTPAQYAELLALAYQQIKRADPSATVLLGGLSLGGSQADQNFLGEILADPTYPALESFDVANFHAYGSPCEVKRRADFVRGALAKAGVPDRPVWVTEVGYASDPSLQRLSGYQDGPDAQVRYLRDVVPYLLQLGVAKVFWYQLYDRNGGAGTFGSHGLLDANLNPRPAFDAFRALVAGAPSSSTLSTLDCGPTQGG